MAMLVEVGLANAAVAAVLALLALTASALCRRPALAHVLWLLVLIKLITPPLFRIPVPGFREEAPVAAPKAKPTAPAPVRVAVSSPAVPTPQMPFTKIQDFGKELEPPMMAAVPVPPPERPIVADAVPTPDPEPEPEPAPKRAAMGPLDWAGVVWMFGAGIWFLLAAWRISAFQRQLAGAKPAPQAFAATVRRLCVQLKISRVPSVWIVPGPLPPMLWSFGAPRMYLPAGLVSRLEEPGLAALLMHELAHLKRGDHWVRWLELLVAGLYWWYPLTWIARRRINAIEEDCCDAWVVSELPGYGAAYAGALLETLDFLSREKRPVPLLASGCGRLSALKRRLTAIIQSPPPPRISALGWVAVALVALTLPLGLARTAAPPPAEEPAVEKPAEPKKPDPEPKKPAPPRVIPRDPPSYENTAKMLVGTGGQVWAIAVSPDEKVLAVVTGGTDGEGCLTLFDFNDGKELVSLVQTKPIRCVAFSPDGKTLATGDFDKKIQLRDPRTGEVKKTLEGHTASVNAVAFTGDSKTLVSAGLDKTVKLWDVEAGKLKSTLEGHDDWVLSVAVSKDGKTVVSASKDQTARVWDATSGKTLHVLKGHTTWVEGIALSPDGKQVATASHDATIKLWDVATGAQQGELTGHQGIVNTVIYSADGKQLYSGSHDRSVRVWNVAGMNLEEAFEGTHDDRIYTLAVTKDGLYLVSGAWDRTVKARDLVSKALTDTYVPKRYRPETAFPILGMAASPDGKVLAVCGEERLFKLIDAETGRLLHVLEGHEDVVGGVAFSPDGLTVASAGFDGDVILWEVATGKLLRKLQGHTNWVYCVAFSPDGSMLASSSYDKSVRLWDAKTGNTIATLLKHRGGVRTVAFSPTGGLLASAGTDRSIRIWDLSKKEEVQALKGHEDVVRAVAFNPEGTRIASAGEDGTIRLWDVSTGNQLAENKPPAPPPDAGEQPTTGVLTLAWSPGGTLVMVGDQNRLVRVLRGTNLSQRVGFARHSAEVTAIALSPNGATLYTASLDRNIMAWPGAAHRLRPTVSYAPGTGQWWFNHFSPDGKWVASGGGGMSLHVRPTNAAGRLLNKMNGVVPVVFGSALSPDGKTLALGMMDNSVVLIDPVTLERKKKLTGHKFRVWSVSWSPDGKKLVSGAGSWEEPMTPGEVKVWDVDSGKELTELDGIAASVQAAAWSRDGKWIAVGSRDGIARLYDAATMTEKFKLEGHKEAARSVAFSPDNQTLAVGATGGGIKLWAVATGKEIATLEAATSGVNAVAFSPDGTMLAATSRPTGRVANGEVWLYRKDDKGSFGKGEVLKGHGTSVLSIAWSRDGKRLASGGGTFNTLGEVIVWDVETKKPAVSLLAHTQWAETVAFDATGERLFTAGGSTDAGGEAFLWQIAPAGGWDVPKAHKGQVACAAWSPDSKLLVTGGYDRSLKVWDAASGKMLLEWKDVHKGNLRSVAFSPDGKRLVTTADDRRVIVWDYETREPIKEFDPAKLIPTSTSFSPDGKLLAVGFGDPLYKEKTGSVVVYDTQTWEERKGAEWATHQAMSVAFSPDGKTLAVGGAGTDALSLYDVATGKRLRQVKGATSIRCVAWSADGKLIAAAHGSGAKHGNGSVVVFDAATGQEEAVLAGHTSLVLGLSFGPDGRVGTASNDGTYKVWGPVRPTPPAPTAMTSKP